MLRWHCDGGLCAVCCVQGQGCAIIQPAEDGLRVNHVLYCAALSLALQFPLRKYCLLVALPVLDVLLETPGVVYEPDVVRLKRLGLYSGC